MQLPHAREAARPGLISNKRERLKAQERENRELGDAQRRTFSRRSTSLPAGRCAVALPECGVGDGPLSQRSMTLRV